MKQLIKIAAGLLSLIGLVSVFVVHAEGPTLEEILAESQSVREEIAAIQILIAQEKRAIAEGVTLQLPTPEPGMVLVAANCSTLPSSQCVTESELKALTKPAEPLSVESENALAQELIQARVDLILGNAKEFEVGSEETASGFPVSRIDEVRQLSSGLRESIFIFRIYMEGSDGEFGTTGIATAFLIEPDLAVTNSHNVRVGPGGPVSKGTIVLRTFHGETVNASLVGDHIGADIALLRLERPLQLPALKWGDARNLSAGDPLFTIGNPGLMGSWATHVGAFVGLDTLSSGSDDPNSAQERVSFTAPCMQGCSGSPVFDMNGDVVAVLYGSVSGSSSMLPLELHTSLRFLNEETSIATAAHQASSLVIEFLAAAPTPEPPAGEGKESSD